MGSRPCALAFTAVPGFRHPSACLTDTQARRAAILSHRMVPHPWRATQATWLPWASTLVLLPCTTCQCMAACYHTTSPTTTEMGSMTIKTSWKIPSCLAGSVIPTTRLISLVLIDKTVRMSRTSRAARKKMRRMKKPKLRGMSLTRSAASQPTPSSASTIGVTLTGSTKLMKMNRHTRVDADPVAPLATRVSWRSSNLTINCHHIIFISNSFTTTMATAATQRISTIIICTVGATAPATRATTRTTCTSNSSSHRYSRHNPTSTSTLPQPTNKRLPEDSLRPVKVE